jgi:hypothetical protein
MYEDLVSAFLQLRRPKAFDPNIVSHVEIDYFVFLRRFSHERNLAHLLNGGDSTWPTRQVPSYWVHNIHGIDIEINQTGRAIKARQRLGAERIRIIEEPAFFTTYAAAGYAIGTLTLMARITQPGNVEIAQSLAEQYTKKFGEPVSIVEEK